MNQARRTSELFKLIRSLGYESALVGGLAVSMRSRERFTKDIDFAVAVNSDADAENLTFAMQQHRFELMQVVEQKSKGIMSTVRFRHPEDKIDEPSVDLLVGSSGIEREIVAEAESLELVQGYSAPVARLPHLVAMKTLSEQESRVHDRFDLMALLKVATGAEIEESNHLVNLIEERGFNRGKDLKAELKRFIDLA